MLTSLIIKNIISNVLKLNKKNNVSYGIFIDCVSEFGLAMIWIAGHT